MAAPGHSDIVYYEGTDGAPANNDDPIIGAITGTAISDDALDKTINTPPFDVTAKTYYGGFYIKNNATGSLTNARIFNRCALKDNPIVGPITFGFIDGLDSGSKINLAGIVGGLLLTETITCPSVAGFLNSARDYDMNGFYFLEFTNSAGVSAVPLSPAITASQSGVTLGVLRGTGGNPTGKDLAVRQLYNFLELAVATAKGDTISAANRESAPDTTSAYGRGCRWDGLDEAIAVPTNTLGASEFIGVAAKMIIPANFPTPAYGRLQICANIVGNAIP